MNDEELKQKEKKIEGKIRRIPNVNRYFPVIDGIIDTERYINAKYKILWILKEVYYGENDRVCNLSFDYRKATEAQINKSHTTKRVMLVSHRILSDVTPLASFQSIAYINVKKISGNQRSIDREIKDAFSTHKNLLLEQIETYNPEIIICGNTLQYFDGSLDFRKHESQSIGMGKNLHYFCSKDRLYINAYHPANTSISDREYSDKIFEAVSYWITNYRNK